MSSLPDEPRYRIGDTIAGRYRLETLIGAGGFGEVYRATELELGREVALKLLVHDRMGGEKHLRRFLREAQLAQELEHPNTVRLLDFGQTQGGFPYIAYQLLRGRTLKELLEVQGAFPPERVSHVIAQVLKSLMEAHEHGIIHRDIKPDNIFITEYEGESDFVKVLDFGIAKPVGPGQQDLAVTAEDEIIGTPSYMAPEQILGEPVSPATDLYSLGLVMAEMMAGQVIISGARPIQILTEHLSDEPVPLPSEIEVSPLAAVVRRATAKSISNRYSSAGQMLAELRQVTRGLSSEQRHRVLITRSGFLATAPTEEVGQGSLSSRGQSTDASELGYAGTVMLAAESEEEVKGEPSSALTRRMATLGIVVTVLFLLSLVVTVGIGMALRRDSAMNELPRTDATPSLPSHSTKRAALSPPRTKITPLTDAGPPLPKLQVASSPTPVKLSELTVERLEKQLRATDWAVGVVSDVSDKAPTANAEGVNIQVVKGDMSGSVNFWRYKNEHLAKAFENGFKRGPFAVARVEKNLIYIVLFAGYDASSQKAMAEQLLSTIIVAE